MSVYDLMLLCTNIEGEIRSTVLEIIVIRKQRPFALTFMRRQNSPLRGVGVVS